MIFLQQTRSPLDISAEIADGVRTILIKSNRLKAILFFLGATGVLL